VTPNASAPSYYFAEQPSCVSGPAFLTGGASTLSLPPPPVLPIYLPPVGWPMHHQHIVRRLHPGICLVDEIRVMQAVEGQRIHREVRQDMA
jgi:hypothetical protein